MPGSGREGNPLARRAARGSDQFGQAIPSSTESWITYRDRERGGCMERRRLAGWAGRRPAGTEIEEIMGGSSSRLERASPVAWD
jgi:hypothetical protein